MLPHGRDEPAMPALPLAGQNAPRFRHFGPRDRVGDEGDLVADLVPPQVTMEPDHQIEILYDARHLVAADGEQDRKSTRLNSSHGYISYAVFCLKKKKT